MQAHFWRSTWHSSPCNGCLACSLVYDSTAGSPQPMLCHMAGSNSSALCCLKGDSRRPLCTAHTSVVVTGVALLLRLTVTRPNGCCRALILRVLHKDLPSTTLPCFLVDASTAPSKAVAGNSKKGHTSSCWAPSSASSTGWCLGLTLYCRLQHAAAATCVWRSLLSLPSCRYIEVGL